MFAAVRRFWPQIWPHRRALATGAAFSLVEIGLSLAQPWPLRWIVDDVLRAGAEGGPPDNAQLLLAIAVAVLVALVVAGALVNHLASRLLSSAGLRIAADLRVVVLDRLQRLSLRYHGKARVGDLVARVTSDVSYTQDMIVQALSTLLPSLMLVVGMFVVMVVLAPDLTVLALAATPPLVLATHRSRVQLRLAARAVRKADGALASAATENVSAIHLIQAYTLEADRTARFTEHSDASLAAGVDAVRLESRFGPLVEVASVASTAVVVWFGAQMVLNERITLGVLLVFLSYLGSLYKPIRSLSKLSQTISKGVAATERITDVLDTPLDIVDAPNAVAVRVRGAIELDDVVFSYGREPVLDHVSISITAGQSVALVGPSGAGKSTIAALIPRLADVDGGRVLVDGIDVREHEVASLRRQIAVVAQDAVLLDGTLRENLVCGHRDATDRDVERAARLALVDEFACRLPDGLDTHIGERGANLSGGQRQRVSIARAILRDAPIVILDEPTSALDAASEELLVEALANLPAGRTRIVIAHRLSTIRDADRIFVLDGGRIVEQGTHDELRRAHGLYERLASFQAGGRRLIGTAATERRRDLRSPAAPRRALEPTAQPERGR